MTRVTAGRDISVHFRGDWGESNLHRVCGWYSQQLGDRFGAGSRFAIWNGRGAADNVAAVASGDADIALVTPAQFAAMAYLGIGPYRGSAHRHLRALACLPHRDRLLFATTRRDISTLADLAVATPTPVLTAPHNNGVNHVGLAVDEIITRAGASVSELRRHGDGLVESDHSLEWFDMIAQHKADVIAMEAIMLPNWRQLANDTELTFLPLPADIGSELERTFGWRTATLKAGYFPSLTTDLTCLDFSDFLVITTSDLDDDVARAVAECTWETRDHLERQYRHLPPERSPLTYPLLLDALARTPIPLHPAAADYFDTISSLEAHR
ncbi:TAXI family TRAP transporter solute-binding subunit [Nocardia rhamnosiphila]|uniref:TAXI family TRAP transporter solute-binding subunit n=1 Tax=Nocardia rhamnosiphila TaxID=426716 RepID=UPI0034095ACA